MLRKQVHNIFPDQIAFVWSQSKTSKDHIHFHVKWLFSSFSVTLGLRSKPSSLRQNCSMSSIEKTLTFDADAACHAKYRGGISGKILSLILLMPCKIPLNCTEMTYNNCINDQSHSRTTLLKTNANNIPVGCAPSTAVAICRQGGVCRGGCLPGGVSAWGCLPGGCLPGGCLPGGCLPRGEVSARGMGGGRGWCLPRGCLPRGGILFHTDYLHFQERDSKDERNCGR